LGRKKQSVDNKQFRRKPVVARTENQKTYIKAILKSDVIICEGPAGTGKTNVAIGMAMHLLDKKVVEKIVIARPVVEAGEDLGYLPGDHNDKLDPYVRPIFDELQQYASLSEIATLKNSLTLEIVPIGFMRGRTFKNSFILVDECQNAQYDQIRMILTRLGENSKMVMTGDITQSDLDKRDRGGFRYVFDLFSKYEEYLDDSVSCVRLYKQDIVRHHLVSKMLDIWGKQVD